MAVQNFGHLRLGALYTIPYRWCTRYSVATVLLKQLVTLDNNGKELNDIL